MMLAHRRTTYICALRHAHTGMHSRLHSHRANEAKEEKVKCNEMFEEVCFNHNLHLKFVNREISLSVLLVHSRRPALCSHTESLPSSYFYTTIFITSGLCHIHAVPMLAFFRHASTNNQNRISITVHPSVP